MPLDVAALEYASLGRRVFPLAAGSKEPVVKDWPRVATTDPEQIRRWWRHPNEGGQLINWHCNIGLVTGDGLVVVDVDPKNGGEVPDWIRPTLTATTPSGGWHFYYYVQGQVPNSVGRLAPGVDVRGERGYVVAPPSQGYKLPGQGDWRWESDAEDGIATMAHWRLIPYDHLMDAHPGMRSRAKGFQYRDEVPVGQRNDYLASLCGYLMSVGYDNAEALEALNLECEALGFRPTRENEVQKIVRSVRRYHR